MTNEEAKKLKKGDRVEIDAHWADEDEPVLGTFVGVGVEGYYDGNLLVSRDDSIIGGGDNGEWICRPTDLKLLDEDEEREDEDDFDVCEAIEAECDSLKELLLEKNESYGNSVFEPLNLLSDLSVRDRLLVRIEDKLARLKNGSEFPSEDTTKDLIGYLILLRIADKREASL